MNFAYALEDHGLIRKQKQDKDIKFVGAAGTNVGTISKPMLKHPEEHQNSKNKKKSPWICHHCGRYSHIRSYCYKLYPQPHVQPKVSGKSVQVRKEWKPKNPKVSSSVTFSGNLVQSSLNVVDADNIINESVLVTPSKTAIAPNVASDVTSSLVQSDQIKFVAESTSDNEKSQSKKVLIMRTVILCMLVMRRMDQKVMTKMCGVFSCFNLVFMDLCVLMCRDLMYCCCSFYFCLLCMVVCQNLWLKGKKGE